MDVLSRYRQTGALLEGHFLLASGKHSPKFLQSTTVMQHPEHAEAIAAELAEKLRSHDRVQDASFVIGPAMGGVVLAYALAKALGLRALFAEKVREKDGSSHRMFIREGLDIAAGERFIAVEDVITTGGSVRKAIRAAEARGTQCITLACIIDRGLSDFTGALAPLSLTSLDFPTYDPEDCPLCEAGIPLVEV